MHDLLNWAQKEAKKAVSRDISQGFKKVFIDMPTRAGKTGVPLSILEELAQNNIFPSTTILVETDEQRQNMLAQAAMFAPTLVRRGLIEPHTSSTLRACAKRPPVLVMTYRGRTMAVLDGTLDPLDERILIEDEAQHALSELRLDTHNRNPNVIHIALTASPEYSEEKGLPQVGYKQSYRLSRQRAIDGHLNAQTRSVIVEMSNVGGNIDDVARHNEDFSLRELEVLVRNSEVMENLMAFAASWHSPVDPRPIHQRHGFIMCSSIADAIATAERWNKQFGKGSCAAAWGAMGAERERVVRAHEEGEIKFLASSRLAIEGMGRRHHDVVINKVPTMSAVMAKQRGGRVTGYDPENPDKEALIVDLVFPSERGEQLLYGDVIGGFLFTSSSRNSGQTEKNPPNLLPIPTIDGLKIASTPEVIEGFLHRRRHKRTGIENRHLSTFNKAVRQRMIATGLVSIDRVWSRVEELLDEPELTDEDLENERLVPRPKITKGQIKALMLGEANHEHPDFLEYSEAAVLLARVLNSHPTRLFGALKQVREDGSPKTMRSIDYTSEDLVFMEEGLDEQDYMPDVAEPLTGADAEIIAGIEDEVELEPWDEEIDYEAEEALERAVYQEQLRDYTQTKLANLKPRESLVIEARFGLNGEEQTFEKIGQTLGISGGRAGQIEAKAIRRLRHPAAEMDKMLDPDGSCLKEKRARAKMERELYAERLALLKDEINRDDDEREL